MALKALAGDSRAERLQFSNSTLGELMFAAPLRTRVDRSEKHQAHEGYCTLAESCLLRAQVKRNQRVFEREGSRAWPPRSPREDGIAHPADTSITSLADAFAAFRVATSNKGPKMQGTFQIGPSLQTRPHHRCLVDVPDVWCSCFRCWEAAAAGLEPGGEVAPAHTSQ
jgi:hypothetical protein